MNASDSKISVSLSIAAVERDTGIGKDTLRVWERRYGFPQPNRDEHGERVYPAAQVEKLRVIKRLMDQGHRPGRIVAQPIQALLHLTRTDVVGHGESAAHAMVREDLAALIAMIQAHDDERLRATLHASLAKTGLQTFVTHMVAPLTSLVGETWARGDLAVHEEHLYTECVATLLRQAISAIPKAASGTTPSVLLTTFPQEAHGLGLLMVESLLALQGCRCVSLGTQTPLRDIAEAATLRNADVVALSFSVSMNVNHVIDGLKELMALLPQGVKVWAGGQSPALKRRQIEGVVVMNDLASISNAVNEWRHHAGLVA
jgi:MerR family transcriptional regulator, light-induced transcriptional regulator